MATKKSANVTTTTNLFAEPEVAEVVEETVTEEPTVVAPGAPDTKKARIHGTWRMHWGTSVFDFEDGKTYTIPVGLYEHLKNHGNIYDTL